MYNKAYRAIVFQKATGPNAPTLEARGEYAPSLSFPCFGREVFSLVST